MILVIGHDGYTTISVTIHAVDNLAPANYNLKECGLPYDIDHRPPCFLCSNIGSLSVCGRELQSASGYRTYRISAAISNIT